MISIEKLLQGDRRSLAKAITLIESKNPEHRKEADILIDRIMPCTGKSIRIGISGVPGVGKSTFIETFGINLTNRDHKIAVLAVDPSSPVSGGSILGDKTRMENLANHPNAFIRPSPTDGALGGVAHKTREAIFLCEAAGFDTILIETVGVGQSEYEVKDLVDLFLVLMLPNAGDELQGIKKGILELADLIVINKADGENKNAANLAQNIYQGAIDIISADSFWKPKVLTCSSINKEGIQEIYKAILEFKQKSQKQGQFDEVRKSQNIKWLDRIFQELLQQKIMQSSTQNQKWNDIRKNVLEGKDSPIKGAKSLLKLI